MVNEEFWDHLSEIISVLTSAYNLTIDSQRVGYGLSDFYIGWIRILKNLGRIENSEAKFNLATKLRENMERRAPSLFNTPLMLCAIYMDPRINFKLTDQQKVTAAMDLLKIHDRLEKNSYLDVDHSKNDTLDEIQAEYCEQNNGHQSSSDKLLQMMSIYETEKPYDIKASVMKFWLENANKYHLLHPLADILHAVPSNQSGVERSFSSFSYIRSKHRMCMSTENLSNVLMIRLNKDVFYAERESQINKILN